MKRRWRDFSSLTLFRKASADRSVFNKAAGSLGGFFYCRPRFTPAGLLLRQFFPWWHRAFANLDISVVYVRQHLTEISHVEPFPAALAWVSAIVAAFLTRNGVA
jgi:hypothetical protein